MGPSLRVETSQRTEGVNPSFGPALVEHGLTKKLVELVVQTCEAVMASLFRVKFIAVVVLANDFVSG